MRDPYSLEAEQCVLGAMLIRPEMIPELTEGLTAKDFYFTDNAEIYKAICALDSGHGSIDWMIVANHIGTLESGDNALAYLAEIQKNTPSTANAKQYAKIVKERSIDRQLIAAANVIHDEAYSNKPVQDKIATVQAEAMAIDTGVSDDLMVDLDDYLSEHIDETERRSALNGALDGLSTGFTDLDAALQGLKGGQLVVIAGRAKMGKTTFAMSIVRHNIIKAKKRTLIFSLEMSRKELTDRMLSAEGTIPLEMIKNGKALNEFPAEMTYAYHTLQGKPVTILDRGGVSMSRIRAIARSYKRKRSLDLVLIDHLGLLDAEDSSHSILQRTSEATRQAKLLAKELDVPVMLVCQLNRALEQRHDKRPIPSDLRDSGTIEQDADLVLFVYRDEVYNKETTHKGFAEIIIGIARDVEAKTVFTRYEGNYNRFLNLDGRHVPELETEQPRKTRERGMSI